MCWCPERVEARGQARCLGQVGGHSSCALRDFIAIGDIDSRLAKDDDAEENEQCQAAHYLQPPGQV